MASGWGGVRSADQTYVFGSPELNGILDVTNDTTYSLTLPADLPHSPDGFWSLTVYNKDGFMFPPGPNNYNSEFVGDKGKAENGTTTIYFGGCEDEARQVPSKANCLPIMEGWNYVLRVFRPTESLLNGDFTFPKLVRDSN